MNLVGNLEDLGLAEILQIVSLSRKSGILTLNGRSGEGKLVFRQGEVVMASTSELCRPMNALLVDKGVVDPSVMEDALAQWERDGAAEPFNKFLQRRFRVPVEAVEKAIREQIEDIVCSLFNWGYGTFDFDLKEGVDVDDFMESAQLQIMLEQGISAQYLAMEGARRQDDKRKSTGQVAQEGQGGDDMAAALPPAGGGTPEAAAPEQTATSPGATAETCEEEDERPAILLVEDHGATRDSLANSLEECGYEVFPFSGGADSPLMRLAAISREGLRPTLLVDMTLPRMDGSGQSGGVELLELMKRNFPGVPVLAMADRRDSEAGRDAARLGVGLVVKPAEAEIGLPGVVNEFLGTLLPELTRVRSADGPQSAAEGVYLGDELLREIGEEPPLHPLPVVQSTGISLLRRMLEELNNPALGEDITLLVLRFASEFMNRAVMFLVRKDEIAGLGQFGIDAAAGSADAIVRSIKIPRIEESIFSRVLKSHFSVKEKPDNDRWTRYLLDMLGGGAPAEIFVGPIVSEGKVVAMLYGDNLPEERPIGDTDSLEIFLSQAGVAMEKLLLQRKLEGKAGEGM